MREKHGNKQTRIAVRREALGWLGHFYLKRNVMACFGGVFAAVYGDFSF